MSREMDVKSMATDDNKENMFTAGSRVSCVTASDERIDGEVIAFDYTRRILAVKSDGTDGDDIHFNVVYLNLNHVKSVLINSRVPPEEVPTQELPQINTTNLERRYGRAVNERRAVRDAYSAGISDDGIRLFSYLEKIYGCVVQLDRLAIVVDSSVRISPPYSVDDCVDTQCDLHLQTEGLKYVQKLVVRFWAIDH